MASSSFPCNYEVFLNFRGEDTRETFTSHLFYDLCQKKVKTFIDENLKRGEELSPTLLNAIQGSQISIIIFSKNYASSTWCLDEVVKILECKKLNGQIVIPIFYHVHPSEVRKQTGSYGKAFIEHEKCFKKMPEKVQKWRDSLTEASYLSGYESTKIRPEAKLVAVIMKDVVKKLNDISISTDFKGLVGINSRIDKVKSLLCIGLQDFRIVGIWGSSGIGKTTLAEAIFKQVFNKFDGKCFMANIREKSEIKGGLEQMQKEVLFCLLGETLVLGGPNIPQYMMDRLQRMKVFIILDDVNKFGQIEYLIEGLHQFGPGSRVIITTRDKQVLDKYNVDHIYQVEGLDYNEALEHLCNVAFKQNHRPPDLLKLSTSLIWYAKGNPLALKVLGSFFRSKSKQDWENTLDNLKLISEPEIYKVLKTSYDELSWTMKNIFLDIACFFKGYDKDYVKSIFDNLYSMPCALDVLVDKSLIIISCGKLEIHDLLQEMGREIVRQESEEDPGRRSRLWDHNDIYHVLHKNKGTDSVKGMFLDLSKIKDINLDSRAFAKMTNLKMLKFYMPEHLDASDMRSRVYLSEDLEYLSNELRYLYWHGYPRYTLPRNFSPENLIKLCLPYTKVEQLWEGKKEAYKLKYIDLHHSEYLTKIPDPLETPNLKKLNLVNCVKLSCLPSCIQNFNSLGILRLKGCNNLVCFPPNIHFISPITIDLSSCVNLTEFPEISGKIVELYLGETAIKEVPQSVECLTDLEVLDLSSCSRLKILPTSICKLKSLSSLMLNQCSKFDSFPEILEKMEHLRHIRLESTAIKELPSSIENIEGLEYLDLKGCSEIHSLPQNLQNLKSLFAIFGEKSAITQIPYFIRDLNKIGRLHFSGCRGFVLPPLSVFSSMTELTIGYCDMKEIPEDIGCLSSLRWLNLEGNNFESLPTSIKQLSKLCELILNNCNMLQSLPELPVGLDYLQATNCKRLQALPKLASLLDELDASILDKLFKQRDEGFQDSSTLEFTNCMKLNESTNNVLADSQLRIQHMATASLRKFYEQVDTDFAHDFNICFPGSRIPEWFSDQSLGSSITIQLPQLCCNRSFIGFALCVVIAFEHVFEAGRYLGVVCRYRFETKKFGWTCWLHKPRGTASGDHTIFDSDHVCFGFDPCLPRNLDHHTFLSFDFSPVYGKGVKVKCCGVCPVYAHPIKTKPNAFTVNMVPPTEEECRKLHNEFRDEASTSATTVGKSDEEEINTPQQQSSFISQIFRCLGLDFNFLYSYK
ncbi:putative disease resistance protein (TIR-NBS-LRR class) [Melia azedarach]|uniref:Disease resistance protein (TIR-NBS-LRR class) n=1 Tax=Melia azedarach TaxID=155640 RepID=A0ACC1YK26_MELAZ|nr:putative disease resistance protein (TIR-NBS-LRR class) [Melia azedarach]